MLRETLDAGPREKGPRSDPKIRDSGTGLASRVVAHGKLSLMRTGTHGP